MEKIECPICLKKEIEYERTDIEWDKILIKCPRCGEYESEGVFISIHENQDWWEKRHIVSSIIRELNILKNNPPIVIRKTIKEFLIYHSIPITPIDKSNKLLFLLSKINTEVGDKFHLDFENDYPLCFGKTEKELTVYILSSQSLGTCFE